MAIKSAFILRYVKGTNDHCCDKVDHVLGVNPENRSEIMCWGDIRYDTIINLKLICISNFFQAWKLIAKRFPTPPGSKDNSWIRQALFHTANIVTTIPSQNARGYKMTYLDPI